jgi:class 3 adenylate cyclase
MPGSVLISYETFAHVKDEIVCEERGEVRVKGISYPVATYEVVDLKTNLMPLTEPSKRSNRIFSSG